jgi:hypothetical protein
VHEGDEGEEVRGVLLILLLLVLHSCTTMLVNTDTHKLILYVVNAPSRVGRTHIQDALRSYGTILDPTVVKVTESEKTWRCTLELASGMTEESHGS